MTSREVIASKNAGSEDDEYPEGRNIQSIPLTESDLATKLFGIFKMKENLEEKIKPSGGITNSCDNILT